MKIGFYDESSIWMYSIWGTAYAVLLRGVSGSRSPVFPVILDQKKYRLIRDACSYEQSDRGSIYEVFFSLLIEYGICIERVELFDDTAGIRSRLILRQGKKRSVLFAPISDGLFFFARTKCCLEVERRIYERYGLSMNQALSIAHNNMCRELEEALLHENYELAAEIRDQLTKIQYI